MQIEKGPILQQYRTSFVRRKTGLIGLGGSLNRAGVCAGATFNALVRIDLVFSVAGRDRLHGTFSRAGTTGNAFIRNFVSHRNPPLLSVWYGFHC